MTISALLGVALLTQPSQNINDYVQTAFKDATFTAKVGTANFAELKKINQDFSQSYRFKSSEVWLKEPYRLKMVSTVEDTQITFLVVDGLKQTRVPRSNINVREDVSKKPGKRQTAFDFGLLLPSMTKSLFDATFVRVDRASGDVVFDLKYKPDLQDSSRHRVWIDPDTKMITKREWYGQLKRAGGRLMATMTYSNPVRVGGATLATRVSVSNADGKVAGSATYENVKLNTGLAESVFQIR